jgi:thiamine biosynthesis lipoprotein
LPEHPVFPPKKVVSIKHLVLPLLFAGLLAPTAAANLVRAEGTANTMGSVFSVVVWGEDGGRLEPAVAAALDEARRLDAMLSNYRQTSEWSQVNRLAAKEPMRVSDELFQLLAACSEYSRASDGTFDITVGPLMKVWGFYRGTGHFPERAEIREALGHVGYQKVVLDAREQTVRFTEDGVELDPGGIGKGYAVDTMIAILKKSGIKSGLVSAGSSSIYALGAPPDEPGWKVAIKDPRDTTKSVATVTLKDESISTSGNYEKFFRAEGKIWSHIMDPRTGYPAMGTLSVSVIAPETIDSEVWAKPYYIQGREWTAEHKRKGFRVFYCEDKAESPCVWLQ